VVPQDSEARRRRGDAAQTAALPVQLIYPPSKNTYEQRLAEEFPDLVLRGAQCELHGCRWAEDVFGAPRGTPLAVELGCGLGHWLAREACSHPDQLFLGIDWKYRAVYATARKLRRLPRPNARVLRSHAGRLPRMFAAEEISAVHAYFPDPWPRESQSQKRILHRTFLAQMAPLLRPGARIRVKTDDMKLFRWGIAQVRCLSDLYVIDVEIEDLHRSGHEAAGSLTLFEEVFLRQGLAIKFLEFRRCGA
jgi:tRNA (guanine-N7-)-methyltransferase